VESTGTGDGVGSGSSHHWALNHNSGLILTGGVVHVVPDPKRTFIEGTQIVTHDVFLSEFLVSLASIGGSVRSTPVERDVVNVSAFVTSFIESTEISILITGFLLNSLAGGHLNLHLVGRDWVVASIKLVLGTVEVLGNSDRLKNTFFSGVSITSVVDLRQVDGSNRVYSVEVVIIMEGDFLVLEFASHLNLSVVVDERSTVTTGRILSAVDESLIITSWLHVVGTLKLHSINKRSNKVISLEIRELIATLNNVSNEVSHVLGNKLVSSFLANLRVEILLQDGSWGSTAHETHVRTTWDSGNGEHTFLARLNVLDLVVVSFSNSGNTHKTILGTSKSENWGWVFEVSGTVSV